MDETGAVKQRVKTPIVVSEAVNALLRSGAQQLPRRFIKCDMSNYS